MHPHAVPLSQRRIKDETKALTPLASSIAERRRGTPGRTHGRPERSGARYPFARYRPDAELDAILEQVEAAGLVEQFTDDEGQQAMRLTPEGARRPPARDAR